MATTPYTEAHKQWIEHLQKMSEADLQELVSRMQQVLEQWKVGEKGDFQLRLELAGDELFRRKKEKP